MTCCSVRFESCPTTNVLATDSPAFLAPIMACLTPLLDIIIRYFLMREDDVSRGLAPATLGRLAYNYVFSHSDWAPRFATVKPKRLTFHTNLRAGTHIESMLTVADGRTNIAAGDIMTGRMLEVWEPSSAETYMLDRTACTLRIAFLTASTGDPEPISAALGSAITELAPDHTKNFKITRLKSAARQDHNISLSSSPKNPVATIPYLRLTQPNKLDEEP
ncbi:MAG: hypothetical protein ACI94O_001451 [Octadecabacter sp.]|jgi:hypothetical protein